MSFLDDILKATNTTNGKDAAKIIGVSDRTIYNLNVNVSIPKPETVEKIKQKTGINAMDYYPKNTIYCNNRRNYNDCPKELDCLIKAIDKAGGQKKLSVLANVSQYAISSAVNQKTKLSRCCVEKIAAAVGMHPLDFKNICCENLYAEPKQKIRKDNPNEISRKDDPNAKFPIDVSYKFFYAPY